MFGLGSLEHNFEGSGLVQVHCSKVLLVQVRFGFTKMKRFIRVYGSGSGSVRHPGSKLGKAINSFYSFKNDPNIETDVICAFANSSGIYRNKATAASLSSNIHGVGSWPLYTGNSAKLLSFLHFNSFF